MTRQPTPAASGLASILPDQPAGSLVLAAAVAATAQPVQPDAALLDLGQRWIAIGADLERFERDTPANDTIRDHDPRLSAMVLDECDVITAITTMPATTPAGLALKARVLVREVSSTFANDEAETVALAAGLARNGCSVDEIAGSLCLDLLRLAQEAGR